MATDAFRVEGECEHGLERVAGRPRSVRIRQSSHRAAATRPQCNVSEPVVVPPSVPPLLVRRLPPAVSITRLQLQAVSLHPAASSEWEEVTCEPQHKSCLTGSETRSATVPLPHLLRPSGLCGKARSASDYIPPLVWLVLPNRFRTFRTGIALPHRAPEHSDTDTTTTAAGHHRFFHIARHGYSRTVAAHCEGDPS